MSQYSDLANLNEDERIRVIGEYVMNHRKITAFIVDNIDDKVERYITKLQKKFPSIQILGTYSGPIEGVVAIKVGPPDYSIN